VLHLVRQHDSQRTEQKVPQVGFAALPSTTIGVILAPVRSPLVVAALAEMTKPDCGPVGQR
jgi:hypothetical protein